MARNKKYSGKDFTFINLTKVKASEFNNSEIFGSCFYAENPTTAVFPKTMKGVTFDRCNLDNVVISEGNTVLPSCTNKKIAIQNDLEDWMLDENLNPVEPINKKGFEDLGISIDPADIPAVKQDRTATDKAWKEKKDQEASK